MQISREMTKLMANNINGIKTDIKVKGESLATVYSFKNLGAIVTGQGSRAMQIARKVQTAAALTKLKTT